MRPPIVYVGLTWVLACGALVLFVKYSGWGMQINSDMTENQVAGYSHPLNIDQFISSQPYYTKLCDLDR